MGEAWHEYVPDRGCPDRLFARCLACPLPVCRYEMPPKALRSLIRQVEVMTLVRQGVKTEDIARMLRISRRSVFRCQSIWRERHGRRLPMTKAG